MESDQDYDSVWTRYSLCRKCKKFNPSIPYCDGFHEVLHDETDMAKDDCSEFEEK